MVELLPAERDVRIVQQKRALDEGALRKHDAAILVCPHERAEALIRELPFAAIWQRLRAGIPHVYTVDEHVDPGLLLEPDRLQDLRVAPAAARSGTGRRACLRALPLCACPSAR